MFRKFILTGIICGCALLLPGKQAGAAQKETAIPQNPGVQKPAPVESAPQSDTVYEYSSMSRRDPFAPLIMKKGTGREKGILPLESYDIVEFKLIASLWQKNRYYAVVSLPDGKSYTITTGAKIGRRNGRITRITRDSVVITERVRDAKGAFGPKNIVLKLRGEEEE